MRAAGADYVTRLGGQTDSFLMGHPPYLPRLITSAKLTTKITPQL